MPTDGRIPARQITYSGGTGMSATDVEAALDELANEKADAGHTHAGGGAGEVLMQDGVTSPPVPIETEAGDDWLYQG